MKFDELGIDEKILTAIKELGFETPTPIQTEVIPHLMYDDSPDLVGLAQTGTGKTAAFGIPLIQKTDTSLNKIQYLILSPTRELCLQICDDLESFAKYREDVSIAAVFGGASIEKQIQKIKKGVHIVSATPGRLVDLINRKVINLSRIKTVVLDEADEMLNMGFRDDLERILSETPQTKNTLLFSATMPKEVVAISNKYMNNPVEVTIGRKNSGADNVEHYCYIVHAKERYSALKRIVDFHPEIYGIVFCQTRRETQEVANQLIRDGYNADALHGDLSQVQRDQVMNKFRIKHLKLLIATDVAARGLDVENLTHIINFNLPDELDVYTHRSGRTGRAGKNGVSIAIANLKEKGKLKQIEKKLNKQFTYLNVPQGKAICEKQLFYLIDRMEKVEVDYSQIDPLLPVIYKKLQWLDREELIKKFVSVEFNRFLEYYKKLPDLISPSESSSKGKEKKRPGSFTRFFINLGKTDDISPSALISLINEFTLSRDIKIGEIEILRNFSFFEADSDSVDLIAESFKNKEFKKRKINLEIAEKKGRERKSEKRRASKKLKESSRRNKEKEKPRRRRR